MAESIEYCDRAIELGDRTGTGHALRAKARLKLGETQAALADATRAVEAGSKEGLSVRGDVYLALGRFDEAIADYEAAGEFGEKVARAYRGRAAEHQAAARAAEAEEDLKRAGQFDPLGTARAEEDAAKH